MNFLFVKRLLFFKVNIDLRLKFDSISIYFFYSAITIVSVSTFDTTYQAR